MNLKLLRTSPQHFHDTNTTKIKTNIRNESNKFTMQHKISSRPGANGAPHRLTKRKATAAPPIAQQNPKRPRVFAPQAFREQQSVVDSRANQASTHPRKAQPVQSNFQAHSRLQHGSFKLRDVDKEPSMSQFDASTLRAASEDNVLHTGEIQGRESEAGSENHDQADEDDAEYERVGPFRQALVQHLTSDANPHTFEDLAANPMLLVDLTQTFLEKNTALVYGCFPLHAENDDNDGTLISQPDEDAIEVAGMVKGRPWNVDSSEPLSTTSVICPTCPLSRIYHTSLKSHYRSKHLGWRSGQDMASWEEGKNYAELQPLLQANVFTYEWKTKYGLMEKDELVEWAAEYYDQQAGASRKKVDGDKLPYRDLDRAYALLGAGEVDRLLPEAKESTGTTTTSTLRVQCGNWDDEGTEQPAWMYLRKDANGKGNGATTVAFELKAQGGRKGKNNVKTFFSRNTSESVECQWYRFLDPELWFLTDGVHGQSNPDKKETYAQWRMFLRDVYLLYAPGEASKLL
ncbi:hypothetical protein LTR17_024883 [Elasticomyces elasticus]|nr:hypothetical protein LTR17_024883 [Elasticomyces elasticus]